MSVSGGHDDDVMHQLEGKSPIQKVVETALFRRFCRFRLSVPKDRIIRTLNNEIIMAVARRRWLLYFIFFCKEEEEKINLWPDYKLQPGTR